MTSKKSTLNGPEISAKILNEFVEKHSGFKPEIVIPGRMKMPARWGGGVAFKTKLIQVGVYEELARLGTLWFYNGKFYFRAKEETY